MRKSAQRFGLFLAPIRLERQAALREDELYQVPVRQQMDFQMKIGFAGILGTVATLLASPAAAELVFVTWNIDGGQQSPGELRARVAELEAELGEIDVFVLQEVISEAQVQVIAEGLGLDYWAISDFSPPVEITGRWYNSLEVAVLSALPITAAAE